jgi:hypothetical protein
MNLTINSSFKIELLLEARILFQGPRKLRDFASSFNTLRCSKGGISNKAHLIKKPELLLEAQILFQGKARGRRKSAAYI